MTQGIDKLMTGPQAPQSALPIGATSSVDHVRLVEITPSSDIVHSVLGSCMCKYPHFNAMECMSHDVLTALKSTLSDKR
jgi:hypothetical protein